MKTCTNQQIIDSYKGKRHLAFGTLKQRGQRAIKSFGYQYAQLLEKRGEQWYVMYQYDCHPMPAGCARWHTAYAFLYNSIVPSN